MSEVSPLKGSAVTLGVVGGLLMVVGLALVFLSDSDQAGPGGGVLIRVGALLGAVALVLPTIRKPSFVTLLVAGVGLLLVLARPGLVWAALVGWSLWVILGRQRNSSSKEP